MANYQYIVFSSLTEEEIMELGFPNEEDELIYLVENADKLGTQFMMIATRSKDSHKAIKDYMKEDPLKQ